MNRGLPQFVSFGKALTDLLRVGPNEWRSVPGGAPWNVAQVMAGFGVPSAFAGAISQDCFGDELWRTSVDVGLDTRFIQRYPKSPLLAIVHELSPPAYFFVGDDSADLYFDEDALPQGWKDAVRWAHFGGISLARQPLAGRLVSLAEQLKRCGVKISYDPNFRVLMDEDYDRILARMVAVADLIKVSDEDLRGLFRTQDEAAALSRLRSMNPVAACLCTRGEKSASLHVGEQNWRALPPQITVVDTVGAGDCSLAGLICSLVRQPESAWDAHLRASVAAGSGACLTAGAAVPSAATLASLASEIMVEINCAK